MSARSPRRSWRSWSASSTAGSARAGTAQPLRETNRRRAAAPELELKTGQRACDVCKVAAAN